MGMTPVHTPSSEPELVLIIGPCGAGKTTYARQHYAGFLQPDFERLTHSLFVNEHDFRYYSYIRSCGRVLFEAATKHLVQKRVPVCVTMNGATRKERRFYSDLAFDAGLPCHVIRLLVDAQTCIARAKADTTRPATSKQHWQEIVEHWFTSYEPVNAVQENLASYREVAWS